MKTSQQNEEEQPKNNGGIIQNKYKADMTFNYVRRITRDGHHLAARHFLSFFKEMVYLPLFLVGGSLIFLNPISSLKETQSEDDFRLK